MEVQGPKQVYREAGPGGQLDGALGALDQGESEGGGGAAERGGPGPLQTTTTRRNPAGRS